MSAITIELIGNYCFNSKLTINSFLIDQNYLKEIAMLDYGDIPDTQIILENACIGGDNTYVNYPLDLKMHGQS